MRPGRCSRRPMASILAAALALVFGATAEALTFDFDSDPGTPQNVIDGFQDAADLWSAIYQDPVTVNIDIGFPALGSGILGQASSVFTTTTPMCAFKR